MLMLRRQITHFVTWFSTQTVETELVGPFSIIIAIIILVKRSRYFKCSLDHAKRSFYRSANAIFGKVERIASEEVI